MVPFYHICANTAPLGQSFQHLTTVSYMRYATVMPYLCTNIHECSGPQTQVQALLMDCPLQYVKCLTGPHYTGLGVHMCMHMHMPMGATAQADWAATHFLYLLHTLFFTDLCFMHICIGEHALKSLQPLFCCTGSTMKSCALSLSVYFQQLCVSCKDNMVSMTSHKHSLFSLSHTLPSFKASRN